MEKKIDQQTMKQYKKYYMNTHVLIVKILLFQFDRFIWNDFLINKYSRQLKLGQT